jgi:flagellar basal body-associated protein FliL
MTSLKEKKRIVRLSVSLQTDDNLKMNQLAEYHQLKPEELLRWLIRKAHKEVTK